MKMSTQQYLDHTNAEPIVNLSYTLESPKYFYDDFTQQNIIKNALNCPKRYKHLLPANADIAQMIHNFHAAIDLI